MTLFRQLSLIVLALFGIVFIGTLGISVNNTRHYLNDELASHAQDAATSLGLSLSPHMATDDRAVLSSMIDAIFDRGYYRQIVLRSIDGQPLVERKNDMRVEGVPSWFIRWLPLDTPPGEAMVMSGWNQAGTLTVTSHPGYAYAELWRTAASTLQWLVGCMAAVLLLGAVLISLLLRPLRAVEQQAVAICSREYPVQATIPRTRELKRVVMAMNRMVERVRQMFEEQSAISEGLRAQAYEDGVTGLGNRRYFDAQLRQMLEKRDEQGSSALILLELEGFKSFNDNHGYEAGDELIRQVASMIGEVSAGFGDVLTARLSGGVFGLLVGACSVDDAEDLARQLCEGLRHLTLAGAPIGDSTGHVGVAMLSSGSEGSDWLANADQALRAASAGGPNTWHMRASDIPAGHPKGARDWRRFLEDAIAQRHFALHFQPVVGLGEEAGLLHYEILLRILGADGQIMPAGSFLPMAERVGLGRELDKACVTLAIEHIRAKTGDSGMYAVNLAPPSLSDRSFVDWLAAQLAEEPRIAARIVFEAAEYGAVANLDAMREFVRRIAPLGARLSLDNFGRGFGAFGYLQSLPIDYLKIDGSYIRQIDVNRDNQFFVRALAKAAHDLEIKIIAKNVESLAERETLCALNVDGIQGYLTGKPTGMDGEGPGV